MITSPLLARTDGSEGRDEEFELYELEYHATAKYLPFPTSEYCTAAYVNVRRFFFLSSQCYPLYTTESAMEREGRSLLPSKLRLTQVTTNITATTMMYKASTFRLCSYKAYMRMIAIPVSEEKKYDQHRPKQFRRE
jgi:hypothetical protein